MTEENTPPVIYLTKEDIRAIHAALVEWWADRDDEPIPPFRFANPGDVEALVSAPRQQFYDHEAYPTLAEKAAIVFYTVNKRQIFLNGNKRMSTLCMLTFLRINGKQLHVSQDELAAKAVELSQTNALDFSQVKDKLASWINDRMNDVEPQSR